MDEISQKSLELHYALRGKIEVVSRKHVEPGGPCPFCTPGVAQPCREIDRLQQIRATDPLGNLVTVASCDGSAVSLKAEKRGQLRRHAGDGGQIATLKVRRHGRLSHLRGCLRWNSVDRLVDTIATHLHDFGGINLETSPPRCFEVG